MEKSIAGAEEYIDNLPEDKRENFRNVREAIKRGLPDGFTEDIVDGMVAYVVPHTKYPPGYHCDPKKPLPYISLAQAKDNISMYHMGIYVDKELFEWFREEFIKSGNPKSNMGKSCVKFKKPDKIPYEVIEQLASKKTTDEWISEYESKLKR
ncbi:MAG: DUF1801 domain-containing protein [Candidatus Kapaibacterium sp.]